MALPSKVVSLWFWLQLEQGLVPSCIQYMDNGLVSISQLSLELFPHRNIYFLLFVQKYQNKASEHQYKATSANCILVFLAGCALGDVAGPVIAIIIFEKMQLPL